MSYSDDYDEFSELPIDHQGLAAYNVHERTVRRRSSKACDQCRKSKCKCERSGPNELCKSCAMLGTPCTFLGPSRKRGPPKGYIDAIEARLHQTEALLGIMLATSDPRAHSLLRDLEKDPLAKEIIARVDNSPYGVKGRKREDIALSFGAKAYPGQFSENFPPGQPKPLDLASTHPSNQWQDSVSSMLNKLLVTQKNEVSTASSRRPDTSYTTKPTAGYSSDDNLSLHGRRQRRKVEDNDYSFQQRSTSSTSGPRSAVPNKDSTRIFTSQEAYLSLNDITGPSSPWRSWNSSVDDSMTSGSEDELTGAVGQLSLNEDEQVRYHGKASGLYLLGNKERVDRRNEGGIWRFPKARVWPPLRSGSTTLSEDEFVSQLPSAEVQRHLLDLYFAYVHPFFPIIHKQAFFDSYTGIRAESPVSPDSDPSNNISPFNRRCGPVPTLLLLTMYAIASRYDDSKASANLDPSMMWEAGDEYLDSAKVILDRSYTSSRPSTCQSLLLMGYREIGIGAMAQAWTYIGMAIRMAQDLGMHRSADGWERVGLGGRLFNESELNERKRIWFGCVIMDKYVSTYIGRPLMIFESDYDTTLPSDSDIEEQEEWVLINDLGESLPGVPGRIISCFNASANLSNILGRIVQTIYAVRPISHRYAESKVLEGLLDKWNIDLPDHLRYEPGLSKLPVPLPNVLTLHMQYWCAVLLLHRPFIRSVVHGKHKQFEGLDDSESNAIAAKCYELCNAAANHITSIVTLYQENYMLTRCSAFLCYYIFTASIMHVTNLTAHPTDPQSRLGFTKCMRTLYAMQIVWPSAGRALDLFRGAKVDPSKDTSDLVPLTNPPSDVRHKRSAEQPLDDSFISHRSTTNNQFDDMHPVSRSNTQSRQQQSNFSSGIRGFTTGDNNYLATSASLPSLLLTDPNMVPSSYAWQGGGINTNNINTHLSTAVLPQLCSTGLVDESGLHASRIQSSNFNNQLTNPPSSRRYPSAYYDYSSFPPLGSVYDIPEPNIQVVSSSQPQSQASQMYIPENYSIFNSQFTAR